MGEEVEVLGLLVWWGLVIAATYYAGRAWSAPVAVLLMVGLWVLSAVLPLGGILTGIAAIAIGYQADVAADRKQLEKHG